MALFRPAEDANLQPDGLLQEIVIPEQLVENAARLEHFMSTTVALETENLRSGRVFFARGVLQFTEQQRVALLDTIIRHNTRPIPITVVSSRASYADNPLASPNSSFVHVTEFRRFK
ncbi:hypothetical protein QAD02_007241 [Eretmocerus hayati]|uniref:Uncharacterized protein n=1 Tax=Eretmocerus hayati TaxID=131215 RepID=A0ACC2N3F5_9HYME|nr:hypothetical protein QAD02_007241 [Eretmocerus hayati]